MNSVQSYTLQINEHFVLNVLTRANGRKYGELLLNKELDREQQKELTLIGHCGRRRDSTEIRYCSHTRHCAGC